MGSLTEAGVSFVHHYTPLHYLPFIARSAALLSKPSLARAGFAPTHMRSMSSRQDVSRGFGAYTFLTLDPTPRILKAKLEAGFPHIGLAVPAKCIDRTEYSLCRYNVAMTRYLRRNGSSGFPESATNGRYYDGHQIPIARTSKDRASLLATHVAKGTMIEVLIHGDLNLPETTQIICFDKADAECAARILRALNTRWTVVMEQPPGDYDRRPDYASAVERFVMRALENADWRGDGLEFDRV